MDTSFSMGTKAAAETRFERAKTTARQIVSGSLPGDAFNLLRIAEHSGPAVVREPAFEADSVLAEIDRLQLTDEPGDLRPTLLEAAQVLADPHAPATKEVIFISDFQRLTWADDAPGQENLHSLLQKLADHCPDCARGCRRRTNGERRHHVADDGRPGRAPRPADAVAAGIRNFGSTNLAGLRVELYVDGYLAASRRPT